jgi:hypothetical protein
VLGLEEGGFQLQKQLPISPRRLFTSAKIFDAVVFNHPLPPSLDFYLTTRKCKSIRWNSNAPTADHCNKWESARNITGTIFKVTMLPFPALGSIVSLQLGKEPNQKVYHVTIGTYLECTCPDFISMAIAAVGGRAPYVNCKHLYYIYRFFCKMDVQEDKFIHAPSLSFNEIKHLLHAATIIVIES